MSEAPNADAFVDENMVFVATVARNVARGYPGIDRDDINQSIWEHLIRTGNLSRYAETPGLLNHVCYQAAHKYAGQERYAFMYHSAEFLYTPKEVRALLSDGFYDPVMWEVVPTKDDGLTIEAGGITVALWDLRNALDALDPDDRNVVERHYRDGEKFPNNAPERKRVNRAVDTIVRGLNNGQMNKQNSRNHHDGPAPRSFRSNSAI